MGTAINQGNLARINELLSSGYDVNSRSAWEGGRSALMLAAENGRTDAVKLLVERGAEVDLRDQWGRTALMYACSYEEASTPERLEIIKFLIDRGADVNAKTESGETALMYAAENQEAEYVKLLIDRGADVNAKDAEGDAAWAYAAYGVKIDRFKSTSEKMKMLLDENVQFSSDVALLVVPNHVGIYEVINSKDVQLEQEGKWMKKLKPGLHLLKATYYVEGVSFRETGEGILIRTQVEGAHIYALLYIALESRWIARIYEIPL
jgi:hypothetical protein